MGASLSIGNLKQFLGRAFILFVPNDKVIKRTCIYMKKDRFLKIVMYVNIESTFIGCARLEQQLRNCPEIVNVN